MADAAPPASRFDGRPLPGALRRAAARLDLAAQMMAVGPNASHLPAESYGVAQWLRGLADEEDAARAAGRATD